VDEERWPHNLVMESLKNFGKTAKFALAHIHFPEEGDWRLTREGGGRMVLQKWS